MTRLGIVNLTQSITAIIAFIFLTLQIYSNAKIFKILTYFFIFIQPILIIISIYFLYARFDPFYMYTDLCLLCGKKYEYDINFLRIAFYAVSFAVFAPYFKNINNWFKTNWKLLRYLYYLGFYSLSIYLYNTSPFSNSKLFIILFYLAQAVVLYQLLLVLRKKQD
ncbi:MAG: hypothetical protein AAB625_02380 [Patescibacteria group bacterium]